MSSVFDQAPGLEYVIVDAVRQTAAVTSFSPARASWLGG